MVTKMHLERMSFSLSPSFVRFGWFFAYTWSFAYISSIKDVSLVIMSNCLTCKKRENNINRDILKFNDILWQLLSWRVCRQSYLIADIRVIKTVNRLQYYFLLPFTSCFLVGILFFTFGSSLTNSFTGYDTMNLLPTRWPYTSAASLP